ncbi:hypothetical protein BU25DRAFT_352826, partial [Macroventuria anomochaeta]
LPSAAMSSSRTPCPSRSNLENRNKLRAYKIIIDNDCPYPAELEQHIANVIRKPRTSAPSPNAKKVTEKRRVAAHQNERGGIKQIEPCFLFRGEAEADDRVLGVPLIYSKDEINLSRSFLPQASSDTITKTWGDLSQPRPDAAIGYITRGDADNAVPHSQTAFSSEEEDILDRYQLTQYMHFSFLTSQWKMPNSNQNHSHAHNQATRDGAVIVNYLHKFYSMAYGREPSATETCHFSLTCDLLNGNIFVHWWDRDVHHMELVFEFSLRKEVEVQEARLILWKIVSYATTERLESIRAALPAFEERRLLI